jgi:UDP-N-acetylglucosamine 2-epimerase (non-hydrolysing)
LALQPNLDLNATDIRLLDPLPYLEFLGLQNRATLVITDSGGIQEETTFLGTPCITVRESTERPVTVTMGTNLLAGQNLAKLRQEVSNVLAGKAKHGTVPPLWDGHAAERIANVLCGRLEDCCALVERDLAPESARLETV